MRILSLILIFLFLSSSGMTQDIFKEGENLYSTEDLKMSTAMSGKKYLKFYASSGIVGKIEIVSTTDSMIEVSYVKKAKTKKRSNAYDYLDLVSVVLDKSHEGIIIIIKAPNPAPWNQSNESIIVNLDVTLPESTFVEVEAPYFDIDATGPFTGMVIPSSLGRINVFDVNGVTELATSNQRITLEKATGEISVSTRNSRLDAIDIKSLDDQATFKNDGGDITIENITGSFNIKNNYGRIEVEKFYDTGGRNYIRSFSGPVMISISEMKDGRLVILNRFEDIEIMVPENIDADFSLSVEENGRIESAHFNMKPNLVETNRLSFTSGEGKAKIKSSIRGEGNIFITGVDKDDL